VVATSRTAQFLDREAERVAQGLWRQLKRRPYVGIALAAGAAFGAATVIGAAELAITVGAGYAAFRILKEKVAPGQASRGAEGLEKEAD
jgi:hypothetical protein